MVFKNIASHLDSLKSDQAGNIALMYGIGASILVAGVGMALDYSAMVSKRSALQDLMDKAALAAATSGLSEQAELQEFAGQYLKDLGFSGEFTLTLTQENTILVTGKGDHEMIIMGAFGNEDRNVGAVAEVPLSGNTQVNLAFVLDTTSSMAENGRITALQSAASDLIDELAVSNRNGEENVRLSVIPFGDYVRIDPSLSGRNWLELQPDQSVTLRYIDGERSENCRVEGEGEDAATVCDSYEYNEVTEFKTWIGCMGSRRDGYHTVPQFDARRLQGFVTGGRCDEVYNILEPLTSDLDSVKTMVNGLETRGSTYIPGGLIWGWRTLDPREPFKNTPKSGDTETRNILLLMTDGANSSALRGELDDFNGVFHWGNSSDPGGAKAPADALTKELCTAIKAADIEVITVAFEVDDASTKTMLQECASSPSNYYDAGNSAKLKQAFSDIGRSLNKIRLMR